jgi:hypothetical protein
MTAAAYDLQLEQGETWNPTLALTWPGGGAFNLTGYQAHLQIRSSYSASSVLADFDTHVGGIVLYGATGQIGIYMSPNQSAQLLSGPVPLSQVINGRPVYKLGVYDLKLTDPSGNVSTIMGGNVWIAPQATVGGT